MTEIVHKKRILPKSIVNFDNDKNFAVDSGKSFSRQFSTKLSSLKGINGNNAFEKNENDMLQLKNNSLVEEQKIILSNSQFNVISTVMARKSVFFTGAAGK
jgi:hypothetical protein